MMRKWRTRDGLSQPPHFDVQAVLRKEALIKAGGAVFSGENINSEHSLRCILLFHGSALSDSATDQVHEPALTDSFADEESLKALYAEFAEEDRALANEGLGEFNQIMSDYDGD
jgi:hypothetical protein